MFERDACFRFQISLIWGIKFPPNRQMVLKLTLQILRNSIGVSYSQKEKGDIWHKCQEKLCPIDAMAGSYDGQRLIMRRL